MLTKNNTGADMKLKRVGKGPVLEPRKNVPWEKDTVFNAAAVHHNGKFHLLYRAVAHNPGDPNRSWIGYASSKDGIHFERLDQPVLSPNVVPEESQGVEDPRVVKMGDTFYMCYTAYDLKRTQVALLDLRDPTKVLKRQPEFILEPELDWELKGDVNNVVFSCGAVLLGSELWVYYGCADTVIGLAKGDVKKFLADV